MIVWIDADAAPLEMKDIVFRAGKRLAFDVVLVANQHLSIPAAYPRVTSICVEKTADAADRHIIENSAPGDLVVTADIALASALVRKGVIAIDPRGSEYTEENAGERLSIRDFMETLRGAGMQLGGPRPFGEKDKRAFAAAFDRALTRLRKR